MKLLSNEYFLRLTFINHVVCMQAVQLHKRPGFLPQQSNLWSFSFIESPLWLNWQQLTHFVNIWCRMQRASKGLNHFLRGKKDSEVNNYLDLPPEGPVADRYARYSSNTIILESKMIIRVQKLSKNKGTTLLPGDGWKRCLLTFEAYFSTTYWWYPEIQRVFVGNVSNLYVWDAKVLQRYAKVQ